VKSKIVETVARLSHITKGSIGNLLAPGYSNINY